MWESKWRAKWPQGSRAVFPASGAVALNAKPSSVRWGRANVARETDVGTPSIPARGCSAQAGAAIRLQHWMGACKRRPPNETAAQRSHSVPGMHKAQARGLLNYGKSGGDDLSDHPKRESEMRRMPFHLPWMLSFCAFLAIALFFLWEEHRAHILGAVPYVLLLLCPLLHLLMHRGRREVGRATNATRIAEVSNEP